MSLPISFRELLSNALSFHSSSNPPNEPKLELDDLVRSSALHSDKIGLINTHRVSANCFTKFR